MTAEHASSRHRPSNDDQPGRPLAADDSCYQFFCKDFPEVSTFASPYYDLDCERRALCTPEWTAEFLSDAPKRCAALPWDESDDVSWVPRPLTTGSGSSSGHAPTASPPRRSEHSSSGLGQTQKQPPARRLERASELPLLILILTRPSNAARREELRKAWLRRPWPASNRGQRLVPFRYAFVMGADHNNGSSGGGDVERAEAGSAVVHGRSEATSTASVHTLGDVLVFNGPYSGCDYRQLVYKVVYMLEWVLAHVRFGMLLKCDDDTVVHVSRLWQWLTRVSRASWPTLYAGHVVRNNTVIRPHREGRRFDGHIFTAVEQAKWGVSDSLYAPAEYPPYVSGGVSAAP